MASNRTPKHLALKVPRSPSARRVRTSTILGDAKARPAHDDRRPFEHFAVIGCDPRGHSGAPSEAGSEEGSPSKHQKRPSTTDFLYSVNNSPGPGRRSSPSPTGDSPAPRRPTAALPQYSAPRILYHYPPSSVLKHDTELKLFCMPFDHSPKAVLRSKRLSELNDLIYGASVELEKSTNSFVIVLTVGQHLLYGVCVISQELCTVLPSFIDHDVMPLHADRFLAVKRCYCFLTDAPLFDTHFSVLYSLLANERMQLLRRIPVLLDPDLLAEEPEAGRGNPEQALTILERYFKQRIPMPGMGQKRSLLLQEPIRAECLLSGGDTMEMIAQWAIPTVFQRLSVEQQLSFYTAVLLERSIVIVSKNLRWLSAFVLAVVPLLSPLVWQGPLITVLPEALSEYLDSPVPLIAGVTATPDVERDDVLLVDLDNRTVKAPRDFEKLPGQRKLSVELEKLDAIFTAPNPSPKELATSVRRSMAAFQEHTMWLVEDLLGEVYSNDVVEPGSPLDPPVGFSNLTPMGGVAHGRRLDAASRSTKLFVRRFVGTQQFSVYMDRMRKKLHSNRYRLSILNGHVRSAMQEAANTRVRLEQEMEALRRQMAEVQEHETTLRRTKADIEVVLSSPSCNLNSAISVEEHANGILQAIGASGSIALGPAEETYFREGPKLSAEDIQQLLSFGTKIRYKPGRDVTLDMDRIYFVASGKIVVAMRGMLLHPIGQGTFLSSLVAAEDSLVMETEEETMLYELWPADVLAHMRPEAAMMVAWSRARTLAHMLLLMNTACTAEEQPGVLLKPLKASKKIAVVVRAELEGQQLSAMMELRQNSTVGDLYKRCTTEFGDSFSRSEGSFALEFIPRPSPEEGKRTGRMLADYDECLSEFERNEAEDSAATLGFLLRFVDPSSLVQEFRCKWERPGRLYLMSKEAVHFSRLFGMESRRSFLYRDIMLLPQEDDTLLVSIRNERPVKLTFQSKTQAEQAMQLVSILKSQSHESDSRIRGRATVVKAYAARKPGQLSLARGQEVLLLAAQAPHGCYVGVCQGQQGTFPTKCVIVQESQSRSLSSSGLLKNAETDEEQPSRADWQKILSGGMIVRFAKGEALITEGQPLDAICQVIDGQCKVLRIAELPPGAKPGRTLLGHCSSPSLPVPFERLSSQQSTDSELVRDPLELRPSPSVELGRLGTDQVVGEVSLLMGTPPTASVVATAETEVYMISAFFLEHLFTNDPLLGRRFFNYLAAAVDARLLHHCLVPIRRNSEPDLSPRTERGLHG